ncbi:MAG TPA: TadE/TadG family type IV pilus assembly protein [Stellaceae bacterium]|nr:TadE/TadG family type IV pilus assembly protein [Stellaceae bacterium]
MSAVRSSLGRFLAAVRQFPPRLGAAERGSSAVEFALVVPILLAMLFGIVEFGRALWIQGMLDYAVEQASRCASIDTSTCNSSGAIATYASQQTAPLNLPASDFTATTQTCGNQVKANYPFTFVVPNLLPYNITLKSQSCFPT